MNRTSKIRFLLQITLYLIVASFLIGNLVLLPVLLYYESIIMPAGWLILLTFIFLIFYGAFRKNRLIYLFEIKNNNKGSRAKSFVIFYLLRMGRTLFRWAIYSLLAFVFIVVLYFLLQQNVNLTLGA
ncbi:MAG: hypothetical protein ABUK01_07985 [Leptospirales bacterium]